MRDKGGTAADRETTGAGRGRGKENRGMELKEIGRRAKEVSRQTGKLGTDAKNHALRAVAEALLTHADQILAENQKDLVKGRENGMAEGLLDRLMLDKERIGQMAEGVLQVADLEDPIGEVRAMKRRPNGLMIGEMRVPLGVVGMIYEARPNVTVDAFCLCFKTGNAVILKGGSDALCSNAALVAVIRDALAAEGIPKDAVQLITDPDRETTTAFMRLNEYVDVLIPRGGAGLIRTVVERATVPVIETGTGNCHIYVDESADLKMAVEIIENAKTQRIGVCNACESLVIHRNAADRLIPLLIPVFAKHRVELRADEAIYAAAEKTGGMPEGLLCPAAEADWGTEYLDYVISAKTTASIDEAIAHINRYNTGHSETIVTQDYANAQRFLGEIDAACVYVNASTRFSDGFEFGFGAEIGISTQKLHARGPMGLPALTSTKYIIYGNGQIRG